MKNSILFVALVMFTFSLICQADRDGLNTIESVRELHNHIGKIYKLYKASVWTGRTIASMQVYDLLRGIEFCRTLPGVDPGKITIAARNEMTAVALYAALMDGKCESLVLKNPPETQDQSSDPTGKGPAIEMLNCLRITDVYQLPALLSPAKISFVGEIPPSYQWSGKVLEKTGKESLTVIRQ
jgi:hypothetical protein